VIVVEERKLVPSRKRLRPAAGFAAAVVVAATAAGCSSGGSAAQRPKNWASPKATATPLTASQLLAAAAKNSSGVKSFTGQLSIKITGKTKATMNGSIAERNKPFSADINMSSPSAGSHDSGADSVLITPKEAYIKVPAAVLPGSVNTPWLGLNLSSVKEHGTSLSTVLGQADNNPFSDAQMLTATENARITGTGTVNGVSATEVSGTVPISQALSKLPSKERTELGQAAEQQGIGQIKFTEWIDARHQLQKAVEDESGSTVSETTTMTMLSINQPVSVSAPPKSQVTQIPASALKDISQ